MQYEIKHIHESIGVTIVYVTHDQVEAMTLADSNYYYEGWIHWTDWFSNRSF